jgi:MFS family permease
MAGMYMPGLQALTDRVEGAVRARIAAWYTSSFTIGASLSFLFGRVGTLLGWRSAFVAAGVPVFLPIVNQDVARLGVEALLGGTAGDHRDVLAEVRRDPRPLLHRTSRGAGNAGQHDRLVPPDPIPKDRQVLHRAVGAALSRAKQVPAVVCVNGDEG